MYESRICVGKLRIDRVWSYYVVINCESAKIRELMNYFEVLINCMTIGTFG